MAVLGLNAITSATKRYTILNYALAICITIEKKKQFLFITSVLAQHICEEKQAFSRCTQGSFLMHANVASKDSGVFGKTLLNVDIRYMLGPVPVASCITQCFPASKLVLRPPPMAFHEFTASTDKSTSLSIQSTNCTFAKKKKKLQDYT